MPQVTSAIVSGYSVPTTFLGDNTPESDGTLSWDHTEVLVVELNAGGMTGLGYSYTSSEAAAAIIRNVLLQVVLGSDPRDTERSFWAMAAAVRNLGWSGICAAAVSAVDIALHDLKAKLLDVSLVQMLGGARTDVMAYGSGGFTNYTDDQLTRQIAGWVEDGFAAVKMKVGTQPDRDPTRAETARDAVGPDTQLFVDANGAYTAKQALSLAQRFAEQQVTWFEEPVSSDNLDGLRLVRQQGPAGMQIAAGEYCWTPASFHTLLAAAAVDTIQADATRCGGITGYQLAARAAKVAEIPLSAHTSPALHGSFAPAFKNVVHVEYFHDHAVIEDLFFEGRPTLKDGRLTPDTDRAGHGLTVKDADADTYLVHRWQSD